MERHCPIWGPYKTAVLPMTGPNTEHLAREGLTPVNMSQ